MPITKVHVGRAIEQTEHHRRLSNTDLNPPCPWQCCKHPRTRNQRCTPPSSRLSPLPVPGPRPSDEDPDRRPVVSKYNPSKPDVAFLNPQAQTHFYREGRISEDHAIRIIEKATAILRDEPNILQVDAPTGRSFPSLQPSADCRPSLW